MRKKERDYQEAVWELLKSEVVYMKKLHVIMELFMSGLEEVQSESILVDVSKERLFANLDQVLEAHRHFWFQYLQPVLNTAREEAKLFNALPICTGFTLVSLHYVYRLPGRWCKCFSALNHVRIHHVFFYQGRFSEHVPLFNLRSAILLSYESTRCLISGHNVLFSTALICYEAKVRVTTSFEI